MNGRIIRTGLDEVREGGRTDWDRLRGMTDDELEAAIAADPDSDLGATETDASFQGLIFRDSKGEWRWRLVTSDGRAIADSPTSYADRSEVDRAIETLRSAILAGQAKAA